MNQRILEIVQIIEDNAMEAHARSEGVMDFLLAEGYGQDEIDEALTWLETYRDSQDRDATVEISGDYKVIFLDEQAQTYLTRLVRDGVISEAYADDLLNYCLMTAERDINLDRLVELDQTFKHSRNLLSDEIQLNFQAYSQRKYC